MTARRWLLLLGAAALFGVTVTLAAIESPWAAAPYWAFWAAVAGGIAVRTVRGARRGRPADGIRPAAQGIDEVQDLYLGRIRRPVTYGTATRTVAELTVPPPDDPLDGGRITLDPPPDIAR